jgi:polysaccharide pyruvyl transferase WcaK-like protein
MRRVLLLGAYGQTNLGDDLLMFNFLNLFHRWGVKEVHVNVSQVEHIPPEILSDTTLNVIYHETYNTPAREWLNLIWKTDAVIYGGGTLYKELFEATDRSKYGVIVRTLLLNVCARLLGKKVFHLHIGIGRLDTRFGRWVTQAALRLAHLTILRDQQSYEFARNTLRIHSSNLYRFTDALFTDETLFDRQREISLPAMPDDVVRMVGINAVGESGLPDGYDQDTYRQVFCNIVRRLVAEKNFVILVPFQHRFSPTNDAVFMQEHILDQLSDTERQWVYSLNSLPLSQIGALFGKLDVLVATRFHAMLLACMTQTPYIGIEYNTKCARFNAENGYPHRLDINTFSPANFHRVYLSLLDDISSTEQVLNSMRQKNRSLGEESVQVVLKMLDSAGVRR